ncbi:hypothetical protein [Actinophytocola oryzae]|uniref:Uncharacterized protein n=1 Tax=Actinophytocola oryzae TaxID=502181 RepID=A0A4R7VXE3_9PSEU|nr:hypothetical protein [Actinophytocola oryzae]TDV54790.1 hypothetical protein CLV71_10330 [Actinophytocola oryzae]
MRTAGKIGVGRALPWGVTSVSLRVSATDRDGNTVEQTVIRAYRSR